MTSSCWLNLFSLKNMFIANLVRLVCIPRLFLYHPNFLRAPANSCLKLFSSDFSRIFSPQIKGISPMWKGFGLYSMQPMAVTYLYLHLCAVLYLYLRCTVFVFVAANDDGEGSVELCLCLDLSKSGHSIAMHWITLYVTVHSHKKNSTQYTETTFKIRKLQQYMEQNATQVILWLFPDLSKSVHCIGSAIQ